MTLESLPPEKPNPEEGKRRWFLRQTRDVKRKIVRDAIARRRLLRDVAAMDEDLRRIAREP